MEPPGGPGLPRPAPARATAHASTRTLQIHYRSKYRELIGYSNAAFYSGGLSVPARHPESRDPARTAASKSFGRTGIYEAQTNPAEANAVVDVIAEIWSRLA